MINDKEIDVISIASYDNCHFKQVMMSLEEVSMFFVKSLICQNYQELEKISKLLKKRKLL